MSATVAPIPSHRFAEAIHDLPIGNLHTKVAEIRNSMKHLQDSNEQLRTFAEDGDADCAEGLIENREVIQRMEERIALLKSEVENRGFMWAEEENVTKRTEGSKPETELNGHGSVNESRRGAGQESHREPCIEAPAGNTEGTTGDDELARHLAGRIEDIESEEGMHL